LWLINPYPTEIFSLYFTSDCGIRCRKPIPIISVESWSTWDFISVREKPVVGKVICRSTYGEKQCDP
jgi:hypothetical protein